MKSIFKIFLLSSLFFFTISCNDDDEGTTLLEETHSKLQGKWFPEQVTSTLHNQNRQLLQSLRAPALEGTLDIEDDFISTLEGFPIQDPFVGYLNLIERQGSFYIASGPSFEIKVISVDERNLTLSTEEEFDNNIKVTTVVFSKVTQKW